MRRLGVLALYGVLSIASTWPLATQLNTHYARGSESVATVPLVSAWALWWTGDRISHGLADYWAAPIFYPAHDAFALSEPMPLLGALAAPLCWLGLPLVLAYNLILLSALVCNGCFGERMLRTLRLSPFASCAGGAMLCVLPAVYHQLGVLTLVPIAGILASWSYALRRSSLGLGLSFAATYLCCAQYALFLALVLPIALLIRKRVHWRSLAFALAISAPIIAPVALAQRAAVHAHELVRSDKRVHDGSASVFDYARAPRAIVPAPPGVKVDYGSRTALFPGLARVLLAITGAVFALRSEGRRRNARFLLALLVCSVLLSMSPRIAIADVSLHHALRWLPGLPQIRSLWRAGILAQVAIVVLAAIGLHALQRWLPHQRALLALAALMALAEVCPPRQRTSVAPDERAYAKWAAFMREHPGEPYCLLPFVADGAVRSFEPTARFMALTVLHGRPMVNGYSSYFPAQHELFWKTKPRFGDPATAQNLRALGVHHVVTYGRVSEVDTWKELFRDDNVALRVYRLPEP